MTAREYLGSVGSGGIASASSEPDDGGCSAVVGAGVGASNPFTVGLQPDGAARESSAGSRTSGLSGFSDRSLAIIGLAASKENPHDVHFTCFEGRPSNLRSS
jgi:hypothetical protein